MPRSSTTGRRAPPWRTSSEVASYWAETYDWRAREALLNRFDQHVTEVDGLDVHFVHMRSPHEGALPLILSHGWPGSIVEFHKVYEPLTNPTAFGGDAADAFHVVAPSLPGFGFSGRPTTTGWGVERIGAAFAALMARLGYDRYVAQGGDWGSAITSVIGATDPDHCAMIGLTLAMSARPQGEPKTPAEHHAIERRPVLRAMGLGLLHAATHAATDRRLRPQRLTGRSARVDPREVLGLDRLRRPPRERGRSRRDARQRDALLGDRNRDLVGAHLLGELRRGSRPHVDVPTGFAVYPKEIVPPVRSWVGELYPNVVHWREYDKGGHFAAFEVPDTFVADLRECFRLGEIAGVERPRGGTMVDSTRGFSGRGQAARDPRLPPGRTAGREWPVSTAR